MAVTSVKILHNGWSGSETAGAGITFNVIYQVEVDDRNDGPLIVLNADDGTTRVPIVGDSYRVGNDIDPFSFVKSVSPSPVAEKVWNVAVTFAPLQPPESADGPKGQEINGLDENDRPTDDPLDEAVTLQLSSVSAKRAANKAAYNGQKRYDKQGKWEFDLFGEFIQDSPPIQQPIMGAKGELLNGIPITNSAFTPFDPPPEIDYNRIRISIGMNLPTFPSDWLYFVNTCNEKEIQFINNANNNVLYVANPSAARVMGINGDRRLKNGFTFWNITIDILIDNVFGWRLDILDRGYCDTSNKMISEGAPQKNTIVDESGVPLAEPVLLDGHGNQLNLDEELAVYLQYAPYAEFDWNQWGIQNPEQLRKQELGRI